MEGRLLLDVVVGQGAAILELLSGEDQTLLIWWDSLLVLDLGLDVLDGVRSLDFEGDGLSGEGLDEDLHTSTETKDQVESRLLLDVVVREGLNLQSDCLSGEGLHEDLHTSTEAKDQVESRLLLDVVVRKSSSILQLLSGEDETLLVWWNSLLVLDLGLHIFDGVGSLDFEGDGLSSQGLDEDLHTSTETEDEMKGGFLLDVVIGESAAILQLLSGEDESLLVWWDSLLVLDLGLDVLNGVRGFDFQGDGLSGQSLDEDLHTSSQAENQVKGGLLLDVIVGEGSSIFELLSSEDQSLLVWWDSFLVLDLGFDIFDGVRSLDFEGDGLSSEGLDEDLHSSSQAEHQVKSRLLLDIVIREDKTLLIWWDSFLVLNLGLDILNGVGGLDFQGDGLSGQSLDEDLHTSTKTKDQVKGRFLLNVIVGEGATILQLLSSEDQSLLVWWDSFLILDLGLHVLNGIRGFDLESDSLSSESLHENLHTSTKTEHQVKSGLLLDIVIRKSSSIFQLLSSEDETLLIWWDSLLVLDLSLDVFNGVGGFDFQGDGLSSEGLDEDLHSSSQAENQVKGRLLLDVVVGKNQSLLVWWNSLLVLDLGLDVLNGVGSLDFKSDGLSGEGLHEDLHSSSETEHQMESRLLLNVVVRQCASILQLLSGEDESLLVWWDSLLVLNLGFDIFDCVGSFDFKCDSLSGESLDKDLHSSSETKDQMESRLLLNVVIGQGAAILKLLSGEDESLLVWWDSFLVLDLGLNILDGVRSLDFEGDGLSSEGFHEDLHSSAETKNEVKSRLLLDVVVRQSPSILELLSGEDETLLVWWNSLLILDLGLDILDGVGSLHLQGDGFSSQRFDEDLHDS